MSAAATVANAGDVHKCATPTGIAYQGTPCSGAEMPPPVLALATQPRSTETARQGNDAARSANAIVGANDDTSASANDSVSRGAPVCDPRPRAAGRLPWRQGTICIGMTDDEVLNLPGWGRPAKIVRTRAPREWREQWFYDARFAGPRQLFFVNGTLTTVEREFVETSAGQIAGLESPRGAARTAAN